MSPHPDFVAFPSARGGTFKLRGEVKLEAEVDLPYLIRKHLCEYREVDLGGCEEWERPMVFLVEYAEELSDICLSDGDALRETAWSREIEWDTWQWTFEDYRSLLELCPEADAEHLDETPEPDPNQLTLPEEDA